MVEKKLRKAEIPTLYSHCTEGNCYFIFIFLVFFGLNVLR